MARCNRKTGNDVSSGSDVTGDQNMNVNRTEEEIAEATRIAENLRVEEEARVAETARLAEEARVGEAARLAEEARVAEIARLAEEARVAEAARVAEEARVAEVARIAEAARIAAMGRNAEGHGGMDALMGMMAQFLERVPVQNRNDGEVNQVPSYLKMLEQMRKLGTKYFLGGNDLMESEEWRSRLERNFDSIRCPEQYKREIVVHFLEGDAHLWWRGVSAQMREPDCSYEMFVEKFRAKYFPEEAFD